MKINLIIYVLLMMLLSSGVEATWMDNLNAIKNQVSTSYNKARERTGNAYNYSKQRIENKTANTYNNIKKQTSNYYNNSKSRVSNSYNKARERTRNAYSSIQNKVHDQYNDVKSRQQSFSAKSTSYIENIKNKINMYTSSIKDNLSSKVTLLKKDATVIKTKYGSKGKEVLNRIYYKYSNQVKTTITNSLANLKGNAIQVFDKSQSKIDHINNVIYDPKTKKKLIKATIVGAAVSYYAYQHKDDIEYKVTKSLLQTNISVNGRSESLENIITDQVLKNNPQLKGTKIAEDPAATLSYGVIAVGKEDMIHNVKLIKDSSGNRKSLSETIPLINTYEDAENALDMSAAIENIALGNASAGNYGEYAQDFAIAHNQMEESFGNN